LPVLHFLLRMAASVEIQELTDAQLAHELPHRAEPILPEGVLVYSVEGPFFFGAVENFERALLSTHTDPNVLIIRLRWVPLIDVTGLNALEEAISDLQQRGVRVILCGAKPRVETKMRKAGIYKLLGKENIFKDFTLALNACWEKV
jgi:SulP family sulfate permease